MNRINAKNVKKNQFKVSETVQVASVPNLHIFGEKFENKPSCNLI